MGPGVLLRRARKRRARIKLHCNIIRRDLLVVPAPFIPRGANKSRGSAGIDLHYGTRKPGCGREEPGREHRNVDPHDHHAGDKEVGGG